METLKLSNLTMSQLLRDVRLKTQQPPAQSTKDSHLPVTLVEMPSRLRHQSSSQLSFQSELPKNSYEGAKDHTAQLDRPYQPSQQHIKSSYIARENSKSHSAQLAESLLLNVKGEEGETLREFLEQVGLEDYEEVFIDHQVLLEDLPQLSREDFIDMGIPVGPRNRILHALRTDQGDPAIGEMREPSTMQASPESVHSYKSATRQHLQKEVQHFISTIKSAKPKSRQTPPTKPAKLPQSQARSPRPLDQDQAERLEGLIEGLFRRQEFMMQAIEQSAVVIKTLIESRHQPRTSGLRSQSSLMRRV
jgi:hypothetical protein